MRNLYEAIEQYGMIEPDARWLICLSSGKDSYTLLAVLYELKWRGILPIDLLACNLDQGQPSFSCDRSARYAHGYGAVIFTVSHARRDAALWCLAIIATIFWKPFS